MGVAQNTIDMEEGTLEIGMGILSNCNQLSFCSHNCIDVYVNHQFMYNQASSIYVFLESTKGLFPRVINVIMLKKKL